MDEFYVYVWYKKDTPTYVGKGKGKRAYRNPSVDVEIYQNNLSEDEAFRLEEQLIEKIGRKDTGEGTLVNLTKGGGIAFSTLYWKGEQLKENHKEGIKQRDETPGWYEGAVERAKHAAKVRPANWQDSTYLIKTPSNDILELKTQELKIFCKDTGLDIIQMQHIARNGPVKRKSSPHYGYDIECLYNKVTKQKQNKQDLINIWMERK